MDLTPAWTLFSEPAREAYRAALGVDDATWARGRGWALSFGLIALPYYRDSDPVLAGIYRYAIDQVLADHERDACPPLGPRKARPTPVHRQASTAVGGGRWGFDKSQAL